MFRKMSKALSMARKSDFEYPKVVANLPSEQIFTEINRWVPENMSTQHAVVYIVNSIPRNMGNKLFTCGIFLDFKKAFDSVDHSILLSKLSHFGIRGPVIDLFSSYINGRVQTTQIDNQISSKRNMLTGYHKVRF